MVGLFCWKWHCWKYYQVPFPLGQGLTQKDICVSDDSAQMDTLTLLCDPRTRPWSWAFAPSFTNCNCSPTFKNCFPLGKLFHHLLSNVVLHPSFTLGYSTPGFCNRSGVFRTHLGQRVPEPGSLYGVKKRLFVPNLLTMTGALSWVLTVLNFLYICFL